MKLLIGCDPELFLKDENGKFVPACSIVPGTKQMPHKVNKGAIQVDGLAAEINIEPAKTADEFADNIETVLQELKKFTGTLQFDFSPYVEFDKITYEVLPLENKVLGCEPDFNAYTRVANNVPMPNPEFARGTGGHVHIGWSENEGLDDLGHFQDCIEVAKQMDFFIGMPLLGVENKTQAVKRRDMYGKAGAFRPKSYGCEYRTPSSCWLVNRNTMKQVFKNTVEGMNRLYAGSYYDDIYKNSGQSIINQHNVNGSIDYLNVIKVGRFEQFIKPETKKTVAA